MVSDGKNIKGAPRGKNLACKNWLIEAPMRMLMNNLDPQVAEDPSHLIVYGGSGKAARSWEAYDAIIGALKGLNPDETLLIQSGKPIGVFKTTENAPRVLIANSHLVPAWATWDEFRRLEGLGLTMFGQMTAGSWIYIGTQGILQGTYETFVAAAKKHCNGNLSGKLIVTGGLGGMGGAQPLAATMAGATCLVAEVDEDRIQKRLQTKYLSQMEKDLDQAIDLAISAKEKSQAISIGWHGNIVDLLDRLSKRNITPDLLTDQTSAHDPLNGYVPNGMAYEKALTLRQKNPKEYQKRSYQTMGNHVRLMLGFQKRKVPVFDYGNNLRGGAKEHAGVSKAFDIPGFVPEFIRPLFCEGKGPFRWVALSGDPKDIERTDQVILEEFSQDTSLCNWIRLAKEKVAFQGLPSRICWLGYGDRARFGLRINELVKKEEISAPIVIGRDHLDCGSVASPNRETEGMKDGSDAIADWPLLNAMLNAVSGATWVSIHHGGGVGIGNSIHAGMVIVADGTDEAAKRLERVLTCDPGIGIVRHVDAGYEKAIQNAKRHHLNIPMMK